MGVEVGREEEEGSVLFGWTDGRSDGLGLKRRNGGFSTFYVHRLAVLSSGQMEFLPWQPRKPRPLAHNLNDDCVAELFQCNRQFSDVVTARCAFDSQPGVFSFGEPRRMYVIHESLK